MTRVETLGYFRVSLRDKDLGPFRVRCLGPNPSCIGQECPCAEALRQETGAEH